MYVTLWTGEQKRGAPLSGKLEHVVHSVKPA